MPLDRPNRLEILASVDTFLDREIKPLIDGPQGYHLRVAINLLRILRRELASTASFDALENTGLTALLPEANASVDRNAELCTRIRDGRIAYDDPTLLEHLRRTVLEKVAIDHPKYPSYLDIRANGWGDKRS